MIDFIYRLHVLTPRNGRQICESGALTTSRGFSFWFVIERLVCSLGTKSQVSTTLHYTMTVCCNCTAHSQHSLPVGVEVGELNLK